MNTVAWPSPVIVVVRSVPHIASTVSGMMVPSWLRGPRGEPTRVGASKLFCRISRNTRRIDVRVTEAACWSHGRRNFFVLADTAKEPLALEAVRRIDEIFAIERDSNGALGRR